MNHYGMVDDLICIRMLTQNNNDDLIHKQQEITAWGLQMQESAFKKIFNANTKTARYWFRLQMGKQMRWISKIFKMENNSCKL